MNRAEEFHPHETMFQEARFLENLLPVLPTEIINKIFQHLAGDHLVNAAATNSEWYMSFSERLLVDRIKFTKLLSCCFPHHSEKFTLMIKASEINELIIGESKVQDSVLSSLSKELPKPFLVQFEGFFFQQLLRIKLDFFVSIISEISDLERKNILRKILLKFIVKFNFSNVLGSLSIKVGSSGEIDNGFDEIGKDLIMHNNFNLAIKVVTRIQNKEKRNEALEAIVEESLRAKKFISAARAARKIDDVIQRDYALATVRRGEFAESGFQYSEVLKELSGTAEQKDRTIIDTLKKLRGSNKLSGAVFLALAIGNVEKRDRVLLNLLGEIPLDIKWKSLSMEPLNFRVNPAELVQNNKEKLKIFDYQPDSPMAANDYLKIKKIVNLIRNLDVRDSAYALVVEKLIFEKRFDLAIHAAHFIQNKKIKDGKYTKLVGELLGFKKMKEALSMAKLIEEVDQRDKALESVLEESIAGEFFHVGIGAVNAIENVDKRDKANVSLFQKILLSDEFLDAERIAGAIKDIEQKDKAFIDLVRKFLAEKYLGNANLAAEKISDLQQKDDAFACVVKESLVFEKILFALEVVDKIEHQELKEKTIADVKRSVDLAKVFYERVLSAKKIGKTDQKDDAFVQIFEDVLKVKYFHFAVWVAKKISNTEKRTRAFEDLISDAKVTLGIHSRGVEEEINNFVSYGDYIPTDFVHILKFIKSKQSRERNWNLLLRRHFRLSVVISAKLINFRGLKESAQSYKR